MAEEDNDEATNEGDGEAKVSFFAKNKKLLMLVGVALVLVVISVGGTLAVLNILAPPSPEEEVAAAEDGTAEEAKPALKKAIYYPIKPPILVSYDGRGRQRLLQAEITLLTRDNDVIAAIEMHMPMIRNALVLLMGGRTYEEVQTAEGKELLRVACLQELQRLLEKEIGKPGVEQVLFTGLIVQ